MPFETKDNIGSVTMSGKVELTGDVGAGGELGHHVGVHRNHDLFLFSHYGISVLNLYRHPILEGRSQNGRAHVHDPLLGDLRQVGRVREVEVYLGVLTHEIENLFDGQVLVLRYVDDLYGIIVQICLLPLHEVFHKVHGYIIYIKEGVRIESVTNSP